MGFFIASAIAFGAILSPAARAYQWDDHYYTVRLSLEDDDVGRVAAICSQLADEAPELNAIENYRRLMRRPLSYGEWVLSGRGPDDTVGRMVTVHQLLHGLTDASPGAVRQIAAATALRLHREALRESDPTRRSDLACALGFALHLYGDSFSHQRIRNRERTYAAGIGHFFDSMRPDLPLLSPTRLALWDEYLASSSAMVRRREERPYAPLAEIAVKLQADAAPSNQFRIAELLAAERDSAARRGLLPSPLARNVAGRNCQDILSSAIFSAAERPHCEKAWNLYRAAVGAAFDAWDTDPTHVAQPSRLPRRRIYTGPLFQRGETP